MTNTNTEIRAISLETPVGAAAHEFLSDLCLRDSDHISAVLGDVEDEVAFWHEHSVENADDYEYGGWEHAAVTPADVAASVKAHVAGWKVAHIKQYPGIWS